jgi:hypothetical protein
MSQLRTKIMEYIDLNPRQFRVLKSLCVTQGVDSAIGVMEQQIHLVLALNETYRGQMLYLDFVGVRDLRINQPEWSLVVIPYLEITESPTPGSFQGPITVLDPEEGIIVFTCRDFLAAVG